MILSRHHFIPSRFLQDWNFFLLKGVNLLTHQSCPLNTFKLWIPHSIKIKNTRFEKWVPQSNTYCPLLFPCSLIYSKMYLRLPIMFTYFQSRTNYNQVINFKLIFNHLLYHSSFDRATRNTGRSCSHWV